MNYNHWIRTTWRPFIAWSYLFVCLTDFVFFPIFMAWFSYFTKTPMIVWVPLTVQGGAIYHLSMGAIIGVTSWQKSQERILKANPQIQEDDTK